jgi:hypothetical protein
MTTLEEFTPILPKTEGSFSPAFPARVKHAQF